MTIEICHGDMFESGAEALVNPVNCVGVMGGGLALEFKNRFPDAYEAYKIACDLGMMEPGAMFPFRRVNEPKYIIHFPTKLHYKNDSELDYIIDGMDALVATIRSLDIKSIAIPALGCGLGNLDWENEVEPVIQDFLSDLDSDVHVYLYPPK